MSSDRIRPLCLPLRAGFLALLPFSCDRPGAPAGVASDPLQPVAEARADALLLAAAKVALPPPGVGPGALAEPGSAGAGLVVRFCGQCHALPSSAMHSATDWPRVLRRMWLRMDRLPDSLGIQTANEGERGTLLSYLTTNALRVTGAELPAGPGRQEFAALCSRCHALPDVKIHSPRDWASVYLRMERNMERMNVSLPTPDEASRILLYLQEVSKPS